MRISECERSHSKSPFIAFRKEKNHHFSSGLFRKPFVGHELEVRPDEFFQIPVQHAVDITASTLVRTSLTRRRAGAIRTNWLLGDRAAFSEGLAYSISSSISGSSDRTSSSHRSHSVLCAPALRLVRTSEPRLNVGDVDRVLDGDLEKIIKAYLQARAQQTVSNRPEEKCGSSPFGMRNGDFRMRAARIPKYRIPHSEREKTTFLPRQLRRKVCSGSIRMRPVCERRGATAVHAAWLHGRSGRWENPAAPYSQVLSGSANFVSCLHFASARMPAVHAKSTGPA